MALSSFIRITLFSLAMVASITKARVVPGQHNNWQGIVKDEAMVEAVKHIMNGESTSLSSKKGDCHTSSDDVSVYPDDTKLKGKTTFDKDFKPRSDATAYSNEDVGQKTEKALVSDFEPRPNASAYPDDTTLKVETTFNFIKDFKPRPDATAYPNENADLKTKKKFIKDFDPRPNISVYEG